MKSIIATFCLTMVLITDCYPQSIFSNPITGINPNTVNPYTIGQIVNPNITVSGIGRGPGINSSNANDRYNANSWGTTEIDLNSYFSWIIAANAAYEIDFTNLDYNGQASGTGPNTFAFRSSIDNFSTNIGLPTAMGTTIDLSAAEFQNITSTIEFRIYGWGATNGLGTFSINDFSFNANVLLPVELARFNSLQDGTEILLHWQTSSETDNNYFSIEKSPDGKTFHEIGQVEGRGTSYEVNSYQFKDESPFPGLNYYRLKQVDFDGSNAYSQVISVFFEKGKKTAVYPTVARDVVHVVLPSERVHDAALHLYDQSGRLIKTMNVEADLLSFDFSVVDLQAGMYILKIKCGGALETHRILKMQ